MKFSVMVNEGPYTHQASDSAYQFIRAALSAGHEIFRVFFYHDGVNNGTRLTTPPQDDRHIVNRWSELASEHDLDLVVCVAAAQRRPRHPGWASAERCAAAPPGRGRASWRH